ncbi:MAG TPA: hypothetical protein DEO38_04865 [Bacteroidales bacterium]|nr:hypothetical protein [Bacteroidales bacterium]
MKKTLFLLFALLFTLTACHKPKTITISNHSNFDRNGELVELNITQLGLDAMGVLADIDDNIVPCQYDIATGILLFQTSIPANSTVQYYWRELKDGEQRIVPQNKVSARFVPERKDDFAWENDQAAYRMYGPALANENPSNGVDLWLKQTEELIVDTFYYNEHQKGQSYHINWGKGLDCYKVGHTLGCGGVAPYYQDSLLVQGHYDHYQVLEQGPLRTVFQLDYDTIHINGKSYQQSLKITVCAGALLNKAEVTLKGEDIAELKLAAGIFLHDSIDNYRVDLSDGTLAYAENAFNELDRSPVGRNYSAVVMPKASREVMTQGSYCLLTEYKVSDTMTYYFGGGWNGWRYPTDADWFKAVSEFKSAIDHPFVVSVK